MTKIEWTCSGRLLDGVEHNAMPPAASGRLPAGESEAANQNEAST